MTGSFSPSRRWKVVAQIHPSQLLRVPKTQGQLCQEPMNIVPGNSFRLCPNEGCGHAKACSGQTAARCLFRNRTSQIISENAGPHGLCVPSATAGPASCAAPSVLAETEGSIRCLASWTPAKSRWTEPAWQPWALGNVISGWNRACPWKWSAEGRWFWQMLPIRVGELCVSCAL